MINEGQYNEPVQKQNQQTIFQSFFSKNKSSPMQQQLTRVNVQQTSIKPEYVVLPQKLIAAYSNDFQLNISPNPENISQSPHLIAMEMENLRKQRAESQSIASVAIINTRLREQDTKLDDLKKLIQDMSKQIKELKSELSEVRNIKQQQSIIKSEPIKPAFGEAPPQIQQTKTQLVVKDDPTQQANQQQVSNPFQTDKQQDVTQKVNFGQLQPATESQSSFKFRNQSQDSIQQQAVSAPIVQAAPQFGQQQVSQPQFEQAVSKFSFQTNEKPKEEKPTFTFGANEISKPQSTAGFQPFGAPAAGFGQSTAQPLQFGQTTGTNPFDQLFSGNKNKQ
ncbi:hypothetical protein SS50377_20051 [Spironucleus salmonicida]|uniref:Uncharacterized protein n=1 Tax=Spironucleus salmonicida TaxID=348837 RepID=V6LXU9_9EUKA|nr:hypothetical protein SS50377_20051 [Spironucleus salmonicida]|eukprot:EST49380.1 Hypothetical protein SS50377_10305 [Spironucleus salmonicida]